MLAVLGLATLAAGCGLGDVVDSATGGQDQPGMTTVEPTFPGAEDGGESSTSSSSTQSSESGSTSPSASPSSSSSSAEASGAPSSSADFSDLTKLDALPYSGNGSGPSAGTRFASPTGNIRCHITGVGAACSVKKHNAWPANNRYDDGIPETTPDVIGWYPGSIGHGVPKHWKQQGSFPVGDYANELPYGSYLDVVTSLEGETPNVRCGSRETGMTCVAGSHGFSVSRETYEVW